MRPKPVDERYMERALELAARGAGHVSPNPLVGAVIVKDARVIGEGWHRRYGSLHAERDALANCTHDANGATMYVTLEPCCHTGKQPPCTEAIVESGISRVVVASDDPNPLVGGKGYRMLEEHGIEVVRGVLKDEADTLNEVFMHYISTQRPFVLAKYAMTLDGKIACYTGASRWVTGDAARRRVHELRRRYSSILVGIGTVLADDPMLTCRIENGVDPIRIVCDSQLRIPATSAIVKSAREVETIIATCSSDASRVRMLEQAGCEVLEVPELDGHVDLSRLCAMLGKRGIDSMLIEGGAGINWSALQAGIVDKVQAHIAPKIFGGKTAPSPVAGRGFETPQDALELSDVAVERVGADLVVEGKVVR